MSKDKSKKESRKVQPDMAFFAAALENSLPVSASSSPSTSPEPATRIRERFRRGNGLATDVGGGMTPIPVTVPEAVAKPSRGSRFAPLTLVVTAVCFGLWTLRAERIPIPYPNDSSVHLETVNFALQRIESGHLPFDGWFPYLSLGSPFLMHYQSTPAVLAALLGTIIGGAQAFSWTLYLLLALWPISVYCGARLFGLDRWVSASSAFIAPFVMNTVGYGFEHEAYIWIGNGLWPELWAMWAMPFALGFSYRAFKDRKYVFPAVVSLGIVVACHFLTAYLAVLCVILFTLIKPSEIRPRIGRLALIGGGTLLITLWVTVPLATNAKWTAANEFLTGTYFLNSYGAKQVLDWLVDGQIYDGTHLQVITALVGLGLIVCIKRFRSDERVRALLLVWLMSLVIYCGRDPFGPILDLLPGNKTLLLHRYIMGVQLMGMFIGGIGLVSTAKTIATLAKRVAPRLRNLRIERPWLQLGANFMAVIVIIAVLTPAWKATADYDQADNLNIAAQNAADASDGVDVNLLVDKAEALGPGRIYAGLPSNWGHSFMVGEIPVYIYLTDEGIDSVGFTLRTYSLMTNPEAYFDESNPGDYSAFGIHYLILPVGHVAPVPATLVLAEGDYELYTVGTSGYVQVIDTSSSIAANSRDLGAETASFLASSLPDSGLYPTIAFGGQPAATPTLAPGQTPSGSPGTVTSESDDLANGSVVATVSATRSAVVLLKVSFDPGWTATVDGVAVKPEMVAPALVGVPVDAGTHTIVFEYVGYPYYGYLFGISLLALLGFGLGPWFRRRIRARRSKEPDLA